MICFLGCFAYSPAFWIWFIWHGTRYKHEKRFDSFDIFVYVFLYLAWMVQNTEYQCDEETQSWYVFDDIYLVFIDDDDVNGGGGNDVNGGGGGDEPQHYQHHRHSSDHSIPDI